MKDRTLDLITDEPDANTTYFGEAYAGAATDEEAFKIWRILKVGTETFLQHAIVPDKDPKAYDKTWDDRATYQYGSI